MKNKKKLWLILLPTLLAVVLGAVILITVAEETAPSVSIDKFTLSFEDAVYIKYAVKVEGADVNKLPAGDFGMLFWDAPQSVYDESTATQNAAPMGYQTISGEIYYTFQYDELAAKNMTDDVYAMAYLVVDDVTYYSEVEKYSVLQYAYNKLGYTGTATINGELKSMLLDMLDYGASAQQYFDYALERLANATFYQIKVENGGYLASDRATSGLFAAGAEVTLQAPEMYGERPFAYWKQTLADGTETLLDEGTTMTVTVPEQNVTYTPLYESVGLTYIAKSDGTTCYVSGMGTCTDTDVVIPLTAMNGLRVTEIGLGAFENQKNIESAVISNKVTVINWRAFQYCSA